MASHTRMVEIEHKDRRAFAVTEHAFFHAKVEGDQTYEDLGFKIKRWEDGEAYEGDTAVRRETVKGNTQRPTTRRKQTKAAKAPEAKAVVTPPEQVDAPAV